MGRNEEFKKKLEQYKKDHPTSKNEEERTAAFSAALLKKKEEASAGLADGLDLIRKNVAQTVNFQSPEAQAQEKPKMVTPAEEKQKDYAPVYGGCAPWRCFEICGWCGS